jgi:hypothetical protein
MGFYQAFGSGYQTIRVFIDKVERVFPTLPNRQLHVVGERRVIVRVNWVGVEKSIHPTGPLSLGLLYGLVLRSGRWFENTPQAGFHNPRVHAEKGHVKVDDSNDIVAKEQGNVSSYQATHGVAQQYNVCPWRLMRSEPDRRR